MYVLYLLKMQIKKHTVFFFFDTETALHTHSEEKFVGPALTLTHDMQSVKITQGET